jgi:hypothetical protein
LLKFFLKQQLRWVPVMGLAWWALDFPFMRRHSEEVLKAHPELRAKDQEATRLACEKFSLIPTSVMNFCEGTRFTPAKQQRQQSPYRHLLKPKAGGIALALNVMGDKFRAILDVTIVYPEGAPNFWEFLCGRMKRVLVRVQTLPVPRHLATGDYANDPAVREAFQQWLQQIWQDKDAQIERLLRPAIAPEILRPLAGSGQTNQLPNERRTSLRLTYHRVLSDSTRQASSGGPPGPGTCPLIPIVRSKLHRPRVVGDFVARSELLTEGRSGQRAAAHPACRAGRLWQDFAGCALAGWPRGPAAWLSLDAEDSDLVVFVSYFRRRRADGFPAPAPTRWTASRPGSQRRWRRLPVT